MERKNRKSAFRHDYECSIVPDTSTDQDKTFTLSIFQWLPTTAANGFKKSEVIYKVRSRIYNYDSAIKRVEEKCDQFDSFKKPKRKSEFFKGD